MSNNEILKMIQELFDSLTAGGIIENEIRITENTVLIGKGAVLDSIAFVTFFMEVEERLTDMAQKEVYISIEDIVGLDEGKGLTIERLISYIGELLK